MNKLTIHGYPLDSREAIKAVIQDMRKTHEAKDMKLAMGDWASIECGACLCCAGGSAVIHGMGGARDEDLWSEEEWEVANFFDCVRIGCWRYLQRCGYFIPDKAQDAWAWEMREVGDDPEAFFSAWERFADAMPEAK